MKKAVIILVSMLAIVGIIIGGWKVKQQVEYNQMVEIVQSEEVANIIEKRIKILDQKAFTKSGVVQSYVVDTSSINKSPMGGINFHIFLNSDSDLRLVFELEKDKDTGEVEYSGGGYSADVKILIDGQKNE